LDEETWQQLKAVTTPLAGLWDRRRPWGHRVQRQGGRVGELHRGWEAELPGLDPHPRPSRWRRRGRQWPQRPPTVIGGRGHLDPRTAIGRQRQDHRVAPDPLDLTRLGCPHLPGQPRARSSRMGRLELWPVA